MKSKQREKVDEISWLAKKLESMRGLKCTLSPDEVATVYGVLREYCLARAHEAISTDQPLDDQAWRAVSIAGQLQAQAHAEQQHRVAIERESAGLDGKIEIVFRGEADA